MGQYSQVEKVISLTAAGGISPSTRVWDVPNSTPLAYRGVYIHSKGLVLGAGDLDWNIFYGGAWRGPALVSTSTHSGGVSQNSGTIAGGAEVYELIFDDYDITPSGSSCVVYLENKKAVPCTVTIIFVRETVGPQT
jgi:hypothetical protein